MAFDPIKRLAEAGTPTDLLTDEQRAVLSTLTEHEVAVLTSVKARLEAAGGDVQGQAADYHFKPA